MLKYLEDVRQWSLSHDSMFGDADVQALEAQLRQTGGRMPVVNQIALHARLAERQLELGRESDAVEHLKKACRLFPQSSRPLPKDIETSLISELAMAYLRLAEVTNCIHCQTAESCILPISEGGIHQEQEASRMAIERLEEVLDRDPDDSVARWLLNIAYMTIGGYPDDVPERHLIVYAKSESSEQFPRFRNIAASLGLNTVSTAGGAVADDFDGDGLLDLITSVWHPAGQIQFFSNNGDGTFSERADDAGLTGIFGGLQLVQADYDNDGDLDLLVLRGAWRGDEGHIPNSLLRNDGRGRFTDVTFDAGLGEGHFPTQTAAWADYDNDGDVDLYVGNEDFPCQLFNNQGNGTFLDVAQHAGVVNGRFAKGVAWGDYNGDGYPDLYVSNFFRGMFFTESDRSTATTNQAANRLYRNNRDGTFTDVAPDLGVARPNLSFPVWFWDYNNDGNLDLFVTSYTGTIAGIAAEHDGKPSSAERDCLYEGDGQGGFREVGEARNLVRETLPMGCNFGDLDNDGFLDFYLATGEPRFDALMPNLMFWNRGGERFADVTAQGRFGHLQKGHAVSFADFDGDGDQDIFAQLGGAYPGDVASNAFFENPGFGNHWLKVRLVGKQSNRSAIGAKISIDFQENGSSRSVHRWVTSGSSFGGNPLRQEIGIGQATKIRQLDVYWPTSKQTQTFTDIDADQLLEIKEGAREYTVLHSAATNSAPSARPDP